MPWPAGGPNDILARTFNDRVAKAAPDGYTIGMGNLGPLALVVPANSPAKTVKEKNDGTDMVRVPYKGTNESLPRRCCRSLPKRRP